MFNIIYNIKIFYLNFYVLASRPRSNSINTNSGPKESNFFGEDIKVSALLSSNDSVTLLNSKNKTKIQSKTLAQLKSEKKKTYKTLRERLVNKPIGDHTSDGLIILQNQDITLLNKCRETLSSKLQDIQVEMDKSYAPGQKLLIEYDFEKEAFKYREDILDVNTSIP